MRTLIDYSKSFFQFYRFDLEQRSSSTITSNYNHYLEKNVHIQPYEGKRRKTSAYASITHFNIIDIQCHRSAIKQARSRDESESALLQNANTPSNGLLTLSERDVAQAQLTRAFL
ncbi:unnamed protein product, partial [Rotaria sordida]